MQNHFEKLLADEMEKVKTSLLTIPASDLALIARAQGRYHGLNEAASIFRQSVRVDADEADL